MNQTAEDPSDRVDETRSYTYDNLGQLVETMIVDRTQNEQQTTISYSYDEFGNRISMNENGESAKTTSYTYNVLNQLMMETTTDASNTTTSKTYTYDANGNQISETDDASGTTVTNSYDAANLLTKSILSQNGTEVLTQRNLYDGNGQRMKKKETTVADGTEQTETTCYHYQNGTVFFTTDSGGNKETQYLTGTSGNAIGLEQKVPVPAGTVDTELTASRAYYLFNKDIQGSTTSVLDAQGEGSITYEYTDFGETTIHRAADNKAENELCYTGGVYDESTGLYYLNARYYDPSLGVFLTEDSYRGENNDADTWNLYAYCNGNPVNYVDPSGHDAIWLHSRFGAGGFGHAALLVEYSGKWYYFSWEGDGYKDYNSTYHRAVKSKYIDKSNKTVKKSIQFSTSMKKKGVLNGRIIRPKKKFYTQSVYMKGSFGGSYSWGKTIALGHTSKKNYSLLESNCAWMALELLRHGTLTTKQKDTIWKWQYKTVLCSSHKKPHYVTKKQTIKPCLIVDKIANLLGEKKIMNIK